MFSKLFGQEPKPAPKKKFFPQNRLEALLMQAANDAGARPEFLKELLNTDLFVLILPGDRPQGRFVAQPGDHLSIKGITVEGRKLIPVFTSEMRLQEYIQSPDHLAKLNGQAVFTMIAAQKNGIVLNPASGYGKEFTPEEVTSLADGSAFQTQQRTLTTEAKVLIGTPKEYPAKVVDALKSYFEGRPQVKRAYLAQIHMPDSGEPPHLIFAIQADGDFGPLASDIGVIFRSAFPAGQFADLMQLGQGGLDDYFKNQEPFFER
jgi:hypothetical protein